MTTVFIARRGAVRTRASQAQLEASRELKVLGVAETLYRAKAALAGLDPDTLLIDLRLEDGADHAARTLLLALGGNNQKELRHIRHNRPFVRRLHIEQIVDVQ